VTQAAGRGKMGVGVVGFTLRADLVNRSKLMMRLLVTSGTGCRERESGTPSAGRNNDVDMIETEAAADSRPTLNRSIPAVAISRRDAIVPDDTSGRPKWKESR